MKAATGRRWEWSSALLILILAVGVLTMATKSSPLYPFNDWVDANCFFTVGKSVWQGLVPYRDLMEQKGPVLYFLHTLAAGISYDTFFGVYLLEIVCAFFFLWYAYRAMRLFTSRIALFVLPLLAVLVYTSRAFAHGDSVEELALAPLAFALFTGLRSLKENRPLSFGAALSIGVTAALVFWSKFTLVGLYVGWFLPMAWLSGKTGGSKAVLRLILGIVLGVGLVSGLVLAYFALHGALGDLFRIYFYDNLFVYQKVETAAGASAGLLDNLVRGARVARLVLFGPVFLAGMGLAWSLLRGLLEKTARWAFYVLSTALFLHFFLFAGGRFYVYYPLPLSVLAIFGGIGAAEVLDWLYVRITGAGRDADAKPSPGRRVLYLVTMLLLLVTATVASGVLTPNAYLREVHQEAMPQFQFAKIILARPHATLLNYGFLDGGFYTTTGIVPNGRVFAKLNLPDPALAAEQDRYVEEGRVDFIVTRNQAPEFPGYRKVDEASFFFEAMQTYTLYEKE